MSQAVSRRPLTTEARVGSQAIRSEIRGGERGGGLEHSKTPLVRINWVSEPSGYAENPDD